MDLGKIAGFYYILTLLKLPEVKNWENLIKIILKLGYS
ncbi:hypothetical protein J577_2371 [Acinetobacter sp. 263903-1]|jgi:hypothetical protein|uniref:Uncharacterized protein n=1 Tax=Acinetobacter radioresistens SK82 TaxID=596318 RepID=A0ABM9YJT5_ACIRA|nr:hypothetical protein ACIRA0001_2196 [Acinetobacter radioresistens SK82]EJO36052.1 hypothetical protein ACINWCA157_2328 [Acinetobacter radioresistens WC-A-157]EXB32072.1 hypothetical protein J546_2357 [Acinetobacter sp. 1461402]EXB70583.1 hypothetical protein J550_2385 [Acinetobacter sp. 230853]EXB86383.1 hypothetical protein J538_1486 [Acinetobacter sp. 272263]EXC34187.1 hypothetical protein J520_0514 [Acinetobacter sp. 869535]EXE13535.1 hypothetical protein J559_2255 [Acinetobacter sp. 98